MKCIAVVMMAFVAAANAGVLPYGGPWGAAPLAYAAAPWADSWGTHGISTYSSLPVHSAVVAAPLAYAAPSWAAHGHGHLAYTAAPVAHAALVHGEAKYTAVNRGAVHEAPLPGHALSQTSVNVAAPAGTW